MAQGRLLTGMVIGTALGVAIGLLLDPRTGKENRKWAEEQGRELVSRGRERGKEIISRGRERGKEIVSQGRERGKEIVSRGREWVETRRGGGGNGETVAEEEIGARLIE